MHPVKTSNTPCKKNGEKSIQTGYLRLIPPSFPVPQVSFSAFSRRTLVSSTSSVLLSSSHLSGASLCSAKTTSKAASLQSKSSPPPNPLGTAMYATDSCRNTSNSCNLSASSSCKLAAPRPSGRFRAALWRFRRLPTLPSRSLYNKRPPSEEKARNKTRRK